MAGLESHKNFKFELRERQVGKVDRADAPKISDDRKKIIDNFDSENQTLNVQFEDLYLAATEDYRLGNDERALVNYQKALSVSRYDGPKLFSCFKNLGNIYLRSGDLESAEEYYNKAFTLDPDSDVLMVNLGTLEVQRCQYERALSRYRRAVELNLSNEKGWVGLALVHREYGDLELAWGNIEKALDLDPLNSTALELAVQWGVRDSRFDALIGWLQNAIKHHETSVFHLTLAKVYICCSRLESGRFHLQRALELNPSENEASELLATVSESLRNQRGALID